MKMNMNQVPISLRAFKSWVLWKTGSRGPDDKPTKLPYQTTGALAKANDPATWTDFYTIQSFVDEYEGIGFEFSTADPFCGVDFDGCRDPKNGKVADWAREAILKLDSYAEVSPSQTGVKVFCRGKCPFPTGKKIGVQAEKICDKEPAVEIYDHLRYFAVTGMKLTGPAEPQDRQEQINWLKERFWPNEPAKQVPQADFRSDDAVIERARKYLLRLPGAMSGSGGHNATFHAACVLVLGFSLSESDALSLMNEYNQRCQPAWSEKELLHKVSQAMKQPGERGYLRNSSPDNWSRIHVPRYQAPPPKPEPRASTIVEASRAYLDTIRGGKTPLIETGLPDLDYALAGGVEKGEMVIFGARPSHGKSAVALQCVHYWTSYKRKCLIVSEEMSAIALGKRTFQFISRLPQEHWSDRIDVLESDLKEYETDHASCRILEGCGTVEAACESVEAAVKNDGVECVVVDYAQLLRSRGRTRYEQVTNTSIALRQLASSQKIVLLVLCQLGRAIEGRTDFAPTMADLKDTGQLEQDADVIVFLVWPWRQNSSEPQNKYQFYICKNRNRAINQNIVNCRFLPERQALMDASLEEYRNEEQRQSRSLYRSAGEGNLP